MRTAAGYASGIDDDGVRSALVNIETTLKIDSRHAMMRWLEYAWVRDQERDTGGERW